MKDNNVPTLSIVPETFDSMTGPDLKAPQVSYFLESLDGSVKIEVTQFPFTIGRSLTSDMVINDKNVSRNHALIMRSNHNIIIENRGSLNGIRVNKHKVERVVISHGDEIRLAGVIYKFQEIKEGQPEEKTSNQHQLRKDSASNDDQLDESKFPISNQLKATKEQKEPVPEIAKTNSHRNLYILLSLTAVMVLAAVLTLIQDEPDLKTAIKDVREQGGTLPVKADPVNVANRVEPEPINTMPYLEAKANQKTTTAPVVEPDKAEPLQSQQAYVTPRSKQTNWNVETPAPVTNEQQVVATQAPEWEITPTEEPVTPTVAKVAKPAPLENKPVFAKPVESVKPTTPKPIKYTRFSRRTSQQKLEEAQSLYLGGNYKISARKLKSMAVSSKHRSEYRNQAKSLNRKISELYKLYISGQSDYAINNKKQAFKTWADFLKKERAYLPNQISQYSRNVKNTVAIEYEKKGRLAYNENDWKNAYRYWRSAVKMRAKQEIQNAIRLMDSELAILYSKGNDLVKTNKPKAMAYWSNLVDKAPIDHEFYIKAKAKLRWLEDISKKESE